MIICRNIFGGVALLYTLVVMPDGQIDYAILSCFS
nr:MAG TPA: hypothetical protein [Caudoviricetes sp.]